jgi:regulator of replication initiation timing
MVSLPPGELEFYERKIKILAEDNAILHGENTQLRKYLREAEEFKIKYDLLVISSDN